MMGNGVFEGGICGGAAVIVKEGSNATTFYKLFHSLNIGIKVKHIAEGENLFALPRSRYMATQSSKLALIGFSQNI